MRQIFSIKRSFRVTFLRTACFCTSLGIFVAIFSFIATKANLRNAFCGTKPPNCLAKLLVFDRLLKFDSNTLQKIQSSVLETDLAFANGITGVRKPRCDVGTFVDF